MIRKFNVTVNGVTYDVEIEEIKGVSNDKVEENIQGTNNPHTIVNKLESGYVVNAPMPGTISGVKVKKGDKVKKGQILVILEAMKMENEIIAPQDGIVKSLKALKGASVNLGDTLVVLE